MHKHLHNGKVCRVLLFLVLACWCGLVAVSQVAMYRLWWTREFRLYAGKVPSEQRLVLAERAGLPAAALDLADQADRRWPLEASYQARGSEVTLSYFKYLLIPRIPSGAGDFAIHDTSEGLSLSGAGRDQPDDDRKPFGTQAPSPRGLMLSLFVVITGAIGFRYMLRFSLPQGVAFACIVLYVVTVILKPISGAYAVVGMVFCLLMLVAGGMAFFLCRKKGCVIDQLKPRLSEEKISVGSLLMLVCISLGVLWALLMSVVVVPDDWDAWAQWAPKAKILALFTGGISPVGYFVPGSGDYPLLWPSVWAFSGWCAGGWEEQWTRGWGAFFLLLTAMQLKNCAVRLGGRNSHGWLLGALFVSMPAVPLIASWSYAEAPFWLMQVCVMTELLSWINSKDRADLWRASLFLAGASATKNEGIMLAALSAVWILATSRNIKDLMAVCIAPLLFIAMWRVYVMLNVGTENHAMQAMSFSAFLETPWLDMISILLSYVALQWLDVQQWILVLPGVLLVAVWVFVRGGNSIRSSFFLPVAMLGVFMLVILIYGENWEWQLHVAWNRLTIQFLSLFFPVLAAGIAGRYGNGDRSALA